jgi:GNAT superfamily N-acetyltransferase
VNYMFYTLGQVMNYSVVEVNSTRTRKEFLNLPVRLYQNEPNWIQPLDKDIENVFNPNTNKHFRNGVAIRWILTDEKGLTVGRVAAFIDYNSSKTLEQPTGGMGFFECINNKEAANILFNTCKEWLQEKGMEAMDGPVNFGERDRWWGLLVEGFYEPNYCMGYHHKYYRQLFEEYGFKTYFNQFTYHMPVTDKYVDPVIWEKAKRIEQNPDYSVVNIDRKKLEKFAEHFVTIFNNGWGSFAGVGKMRKAQAMALLKSFKPILDERLILFAFHKEEPIGFLIMLPELNQVVKHLNGQFNLYAKLKLIYLLKYKKVCNKALGLIFGIVPQFQGKGVDGALINGFAKWALRDDYPYTDIELNWIGDFNPTMCKMVEQIGAKIRKTHITYRFMFDPLKEVKPYKRVN